MSEAKTPRPTRWTKDEHAVDRYIERWASPHKKFTRTIYMQDLRRIMIEAKPGMWIEDEKQQIWEWEGYFTRFSKVCIVRLVVDMDGVLRTVLPEGSERPASRQPRKFSDINGEGN